MQKAEYRNRKKGMETGRTEEERSTGGTAARGEREEGKRKRRRLSSQKQAEADERRRKQAESPEEKRTRGSGKEGKHRWNGCGSETGKDERKQTESRVLENGRETREIGWNGSGKARKLKGGEAAPERPT